jgi:hypothetical protein
MTRMTQRQPLLGTKPMRQATLSDILYTPAQFDEAVQLYNTVQSHQFAKILARRVIQPHLREIEKRVGQQCDPTYLAYAVLYAFTKQGRKP